MGITGNNNRTCLWVKKVLQKINEKDLVNNNLIVQIDIYYLRSIIDILNKSMLKFFTKAKDQ